MLWKKIKTEKIVALNLEVDIRALAKTIFTAHATSGIGYHFLVFFVGHLTINPVLIHKINTIFAKAVTLPYVKCLNWVENMKSYPSFMWFCGFSLISLLFLLFWLLFYVVCVSYIVRISLSSSFLHTIIPIVGKIIVKSKAAWA